MPKVILPNGEEIEGKQLDFETIKESWNEYKLEDGNTLQIKLVVMDVIKTDTIDPTTNQRLYYAKSQNVMRVIEEE